MALEKDLNVPPYFDDYDPDKNYYPDANSTLRLTYGRVLDYDPRDAVKYFYYVLCILSNRSINFDFTAQ